jgi:hypothetical protein
MSCAFFLLASLALSLTPIWAGSSLPPVDFNRQIRPILSNHCFACHGPDEKVREAGLRLDLKEGLFEKRGKYHPVVPGDSSKSRLFQRISAEHEAARMPPPRFDRQLSQEQVDLIQRWIEEGAQWQNHWAFVAPRRPVVPRVGNRSWARNPIDSFILARLEKEGLEPSPETDRVALLRRVTLDLTGLPPSLDEIDAFLSDDSPDAYEKVVDRLLGSPHYGERMAMEWLDVGRYADTHGFHIDSHRDMWLWRDWVIDAFQKNLPFDRFTIEQLAGDLLPGATVEQRIATGFNRNHMINFEGGAIPEEYQVEYMVDRVNTTSTVWMGLTMGCARCHDHKYDPIRQREFYQFSAFFNTISEKGLDGRKGNAEPFLQVPSPTQAQIREDLQEAIRSIESAMPEERVAALMKEWERSAPARLPQDPTAELLAHYELDGHTADTNGFYRHGRVRGEELQYGEGRVGEAAKFNGRNHVDLGELGDFESTEPFSIGVWVYLSGEGDGAVVARMDDSTDGLRGYEIFLGDFKAFDGPKYSGPLLMAHLAHAGPGNALKVRTLRPVSLNSWHHLALTYDGFGKASGVKLYKDGDPQEVELVHDALEGSIKTSAPLHLGQRLKQSGFSGRMDEVRIYGRELEAEEVQQLAIYQPVRANLKVPPQDRTEDQQKDLRSFYLLKEGPTRYRELYAKLVAQRERQEELEKAIPTTMVMKEMEEPRDTVILDRGDYRLRGEKVPAGVPSALSPLPQNAPGNRLGLAEWLVHPDHPLTARVTVNRYWQMYFGNGFVKTAENFGSQGDAPSHPQLLDWLATEFRSGWDVKGLQRLIVTSATYRQSSRVTPELLENDPENRLLARASRFRLSAEAIRDNALAASGLLNRRIGGASVFPYQPGGLWKEMAYGEKYTAQYYQQSQGQDLYRRTMYTFWKRTIPPPTLVAFDAPDRETCTVRRARTNTPLQALILMNDPTYVEAARVLAERIMRKTRLAVNERIDLAFRLATARHPTAEEVVILRRIFQAQLAENQSDPESAALLLQVGESPFDPSLDRHELAAWTTVASSILNLDETITRE